MIKRREMAKQKRAKLTYKEMMQYMNSMRVSLNQLARTLESLNVIVNHYIDFKHDGPKFVEYLKAKRERAREESLKKKKEQEKEVLEEK